MLPSDSADLCYSAVITATLQWLVSGDDFRMRLSSRPSTLGSSASVMTRSGCNAMAMRSAASPSSACTSVPSNPLTHALGDQMNDLVVVDDEDDRAGEIGERLGGANARRLGQFRRAALERRRRGGGEKRQPPARARFAEAAATGLAEQRRLARDTRAPFRRHRVIDGCTPWAMECVFTYGKANLRSSPASLSLPTKARAVPRARFDVTPLQSWTVVRHGLFFRPRENRTGARKLDGAATVAARQCSERRCITPLRASAPG